MHRTSLFFLLIATCAFAQVGSPVQEALKAIQARDFNGAQLWTQQLRNDPTLDMLSVINLMNAYNMSGRPNDALKFGESLVPRFRNAGLLVQIAGLQVKLNRLEEAIDTYQQALPLASGTTISFIEEGMGYVYWMLGQREEFLAHYRKGLVGRTGLSRARMLRRMGEYAEAADGFRAFLQQYPDNPLAIDGLAFCLAELNQDLDLAYRVAQRGVTMNPKSPTLQATLAWVQFKRGKLEDAGRILYSSLQMDGGMEDGALQHFAAVLDARAVWTAERRELRALLDTKLEPKEMARLRTLLRAGIK